MTSLAVRVAVTWLLLGAGGCALAPTTRSDRPAPAAPIAAGNGSPAAVANRDRLVRLQVRGLSGDDYRLHAECESGHTALERGRADGCHELRLPPGPCVITVIAGPPEALRRFEHAFTVASAPEQDVQIDLRTPR
jgi:hypothetical protein